MSLLTERAFITEYLGITGDEPCFLCAVDLGEPSLGNPVIHWMGSQGDIFFHRDCVPSFCRRILQDWERRGPG
jgi:hypothetical protein